MRAGALAQATAGPSSRPRRRRCRPRRCAAPGSFGTSPIRTARGGREVGAERAGQQHLLDVARARRRAPRAAASSRWRWRPWRTAARGRRAGRGRRSRSTSASAPGRCRTKTRSSPILVEPVGAAPGASSAASSSVTKRPGRVEQPGAGPARPRRRPGRSRTGRPGSTSPMTLELDVVAVDLDDLDGAVGGAHAAADRAALEGRAGRRGGGQRSRSPSPSTISQLVPTSMNSRSALVAVHAGGQHAGDDVAADVGAERGEHDARGPAGARASAELGRPARTGGVARRHDERRDAERLGVDAERERGHRGVAGDGDLVDLGRVDAALARTPRAASSASVSCAAALQPVERLGVHHRRADPGDHVAAERLLLVEHRAHRDRRAGGQVEQRRDDGRGAEVEGDRVAAARSCRRARRRSAPRRRSTAVTLKSAARSTVGSRRSTCRSTRAARGRRSRRAAARGRCAGPPASARPARRSASAPPGAGSPGGRRRPCAALGRVVSGGTSTARSCVAWRQAGQPPAVAQLGRR